MAEENSTQQTPSTQDPPDWYKNPPAWMTQQNHQSNNPTPNPTVQQPTGASGSDTLLTELRAMPERITNALKEAMVPPKQPSSTPPANDSTKSGETGGAQTEPQKTPGKPQGKTRGDKFRDWWFN